MSSDEQDSVSRRVASYAAEVNEARQEALKAMFEYDRVEQLHNIAPNEVAQSEVQKAHWNFQRSVILYLTYLFSYVKSEDAVLDQNLNGGGEEDVSFRTLMAEHGDTDNIEIDCGDAMDPDATETREVPVLQPPNALRNGVHALNQLALRMGYLPAKKERTPHTEPSKKDLRRLMHVRGQGEAADQMPGGDD